MEGKGLRGLLVDKSGHSVLVALMGKKNPLKGLSFHNVNTESVLDAGIVSLVCLFSL